MEQNEKGLMQWEKDFLISITIEPSSFVTSDTILYCARKYFFSMHKNEKTRPFTQ